MKITIHQPEHFPYMGFFQKMESADLFVILDDVQYTKNNFQNRNKFQNKNGVDEWFSVELEQHANSKLIKDILVSQNPKWKRIILNKLQTNLFNSFNKRKFILSKIFSIFFFGNNYNSNIKVLIWK